MHPFHRLPKNLQLKWINRVSKFAEISFYKSKSQSNKLVVFVHGFSGHSEKTWGGLMSCVLNDNYFQSSDLIFYGYDSIFTQINNSGLELYNFLSKFIADPENTIYGSMERGKYQNYNFEEYKEIVLIGHSLGAILIRLNLYIAYIESLKSNKKNWLEKTKSIYYAPAHCGSYAADSVNDFIKSSAKSLFESWLHNFAKYKAPVAFELTTNSKFINSLKLKLEDLKNHNNSNSSVKSIFPNCIFWAEDEKVVFNDLFHVDDALPKYSYGTNHESICKKISNTDDIYKTFKNSLA